MPIRALGGLRHERSLRVVPIKRRRSGTTCGPAVVGANSGLNELHTMPHPPLLARLPRLHRGSRVGTGRWRGAGVKLYKVPCDALRVVTRGRTQTGTH